MLAVMFGMLDAGLRVKSRATITLLRRKSGLMKKSGEVTKSPRDGTMRRVAGKGGWQSVPPIPNLRRKDLISFEDALDAVKRPIP